jgi:hypothetical protein
MRTLDNQYGTQNYTAAPASPAWMQAPAQAPVHVQTQAPGHEGKGLMISGYIMVALTLLIPLFALPGLIIGIITASVKKTQRGHGAAIIVLSLVVGVLAFAFWASINTA